MQVKKLHEMQGIKLAVKQTSAEARIIALEAQLGINSQPKKGDVKLEGETPETSVGKNQRESCNNLQGIMWQLQETQLTPLT